MKLFIKRMSWFHLPYLTLTYIINVIKQFVLVSVTFDLVKTELFFPFLFIFSFSLLILTFLLACI